MSFDIWHLFIAGVAYLLLLFLIAWQVENKTWLKGMAQHPLIYTLSLGVYATSWSFYGSVGFAQQQGYAFLTIYLGVTLAWLLSPLLFSPMLKLCKDYQLSSLADLFAFRYQSQWVGGFVTLFMLLGSLPYIALQIHAVTESMQVLTREATPSMIALGFCLTLVLFAILFGARHSSAREQHEGLVVAIAFESVIKLVALLSVGLFAVYGVFGSFEELDNWLSLNPEKQQALFEPIREGSWNSLILLSFTAALFLPRQFHMGITENQQSHSLKSASWAFPLFLLLLNLPIPIILWAGEYSQTTTSADFYVLGITLNSQYSWLPLVTFIGGLSAASAMMIVTSLALAAMCMNHFVLPLSFPYKLKTEINVYRWLLYGRRILIALIIMSGYGFYLFLVKHQGLVQLGLISFVAVAQFLPGTIGLLFWRGANHKGVLAGLLGGSLTWGYALLLPLLIQAGMVADTITPFGNYISSNDPWTEVTFWSLSINTVLFVVVSLLTRASQAEQDNALNCCQSSLTPPKGIMVLRSTQQIRDQLALVTGHEMAYHEVNRALNDLNMSDFDTHPLRLRQLRERIERNLSGLLGPLLAKVVVNQNLLLDANTQDAFTSSVRFMENQLEDSRTELKGVAAELDELRRYHRQILEDLPLGVCTIGKRQEILYWNKAIERLSGISAKAVVGENLKQLTPPWDGLLTSFVHSDELHLHKIQVQMDKQKHILNLHKSTLLSTGKSPRKEQNSGIVLLVEDLSDMQQLENRLAHSERLASVGRLAAGVAHEIGNPVAGIASVTQNLIHEDDQEYLNQHLTENLEDILTQTRRITTIVKSLSSFSHSGNYLAPPHEPVKLQQCIDESIHLVKLSHKIKQQQFNNLSVPEHYVSGDQQQLSQVFVNLLNNSCDASDGHKPIIIRSQMSENVIIIEVIDHGKGISEANQKRLFEPFFSTKKVGGGMGLGLSIVYNIIRDHGGTIAVTSNNDEGSTFTIKLPKVKFKQENTYT